MHRVARLQRAAGCRARRLVKTGVVPQATYGAAVNGASDEELRRFRATTAPQLGPSARGRCLDRLLLLHDDPAHDAAVAPIARWARQVWAADRGETGAPEMPALLAWWRGAEPTRCRRWTDVRGPLSAAALSARRLGWEFVGPLELQDDRGYRVLLSDASPRMVADLLRDGARRQRERKIAAKAPHAILHAKQAILQAFETGLEAGLAYERRATVLLFASEDKEEGVAAFLEKRKPDFKGS